MKYFKKIIGKKCYLSPINSDDAEQYTEWVNDEDVFKTLSFASKNISLDTEKETLEKLSSKHVYSILLLEDDTLLGSCGLENIDYLNRTAELGIVIGNKPYWNKGYGTEALSLLLQYGFNYLNLRNVMLRVLSFNERALSCYKKLGFKEIGSRRKARTINQVEYDIVYMDLLNDDFGYGRVYTDVVG